MRKITTLSVMVVTMTLLFGQLVSAQDGQSRTRGQRGAGQQDQQARGQRGAGQQDQQGRGQRGQRGPERGVSILALAAIEAVQSEIEMLEDQVKDLEDLQEKLRSDRGPQSQRGRGDNADGEDSAASEKKADEALKNILLDHQYARLREIHVQVLGMGALQDETIAKELNISEKQKTAMKEANDQARQNAMEEFGKLRESGDREAIQEKMTEIRSETESKVLSVLTAKQKSSFEKMKGEAFEMPADAMRGQRGGGQRGGGQRGGGQRGGGQRGGGDQAEDGDDGN